MELGWKSKWGPLSQQWAGLSPPAVPSFGDLLCFDRGLSTVNVQSTLVLGSTPSLRKLVSESSSAHNVCVDYSKENYDQMSKGLTLSNELFVQSDWLKMDKNISDVGISVILGDKAIDNVALEKWPVFLNTCTNVLAKDGLLLLHVGFPDESLISEDPIDLIKKYSALANDGKMMPFDAEAALWEDLLSASARFEEDFLSLSRFECLLQSPKLSEQERIFFQTMVRNHIVSWSSKWANFDRSFLVKSMSDAGYELTFEDYANDYKQAPFQPIFGFQKSDLSK